MLFRASGVESVDIGFGIEVLRSVRIYSWGLRVCLPKLWAWQRPM